MLKFEEHEVTKIIGNEIAYSVNDMGFITYEEVGFIQAAYPPVWGWCEATYLISEDKLHLVYEGPQFYA